MTLYIDGSLLKNPANTLDTYESFMQNYEQSLKNGAVALRSIKSKQFTTADFVLYVNQREFAVLSNNDSKKISKLGTDMATTCHMVVLRCPKTKTTALGHFDGVETSHGVNDMVDAVLRESIHISPPTLEGVDLDLHIIGGFNDSGGLSKHLTLELLGEFYSYTHKRDLPKVRIHLKTYCACSLNNKLMNTRYSVHENAPMISSPTVFGIMVDAQTGEIVPATFHEAAKEPEPALRSARSLNGVRMMPNIYRTRDSCFVLESFTYDKMRNIDSWVEAPDELIRKYMSTSPKVEPENFEEGIRKTLIFIQKNPDPMETVFKDTKVLIFDPDFSENKLSWKKRI